MLHTLDIIKKAACRQEWFRHSTLENEKDKINEKLYGLLKKVAAKLAKKLSTSFANSSVIKLPQRSRLKMGYKGFYSLEEVNLIRETLPTIEQLIKSPSLQQLLKAPLLQFIALSSLLLKKHKQYNIDVFYELSQLIKTVITSHKASSDFIEKIEQELLPNLIKSNFDPTLILDLTYEYYQEKTSTFNDLQKSNYLKKNKRELKRHLLTADTFCFYHHYNRKSSALRLIIKNCQQEIKHLEQIISTTTQYQSHAVSPSQSAGEKWENPHPLPFLAKRKDVTIFLLALKEIGFIPSDLKEYKLAHCIEASSLYQSKEPMKNVELLFSKIRNGEVRPSPSLIKVCTELLNFIKNTLPDN